MNRILRKFPLHTFLFIPFLIFFLYAQNFNEVKFSMVLRSLFIGIAATVLSFFLLKLYFKESMRAGIFETIMLIGFFNYGVMYEWLERIYYEGGWPMHHIHRYLILFFLLSFVFFLILIKRIKRDFGSVNLFLNTLVGVLFLYNVMFVSLHKAKLSLSKPTSSRIELSPVEKGKIFPDIYYIVLDGYANQQTLNKYYQFDNSDFIDFLRKRSFYVADSSFSNYYYTYPSLCATLNLKYNEKDQNVAQSLHNNMLFHILKSQGYQIINLKSGYAVSNTFNDLDHSIDIDGPNEFERATLKYTLLRIDDVIGVFSYIRVKSQFRNIDQSFSFSGKPKFCLIHIVSPHPPFVMTKTGDFRFQRKYAENSWEPKQSYVDQSIYINSQIQKFVDKILAQPSPVPPIIIIQSDHGPWISSKDPKEIFEARSRILNAFYVHENAREKLYPSISSVNTFRFILNLVLDLKIPLLPDTRAGEASLKNDPAFEKRTITK